MATIQLIKEANTVAKKVGDIVEYYDDEHKFSEYELMHFDFINISGYKRIELINVMPRPKTAIAHKLAVGGQWTFSEPESRRVWFNEDTQKWCEINVRPKSFLNLSGLTQNELDLLASPTFPGTEKEKILLAKTTNRISESPENLIEISELPPLAMEAIPR